MAFGLCFAALAPLVPGASPARAQSLQQSIDQAQPGDTVWVDPGDYRRAVSVDEAIVIKGTGDGVRLVGLTGSSASVEDIAFDGSLDSAENPLVEADSGLELHRCRFSNAIQGVLLRDGASEVRIEDCEFDGTLQGVTLSPLAQSLHMERSQLLDCLTGVIGENQFVCVPGPDRIPALRCEEACGKVSLVEVLFQGGENQVDLEGDYLLVVSDSQLLGGIIGVQGSGIRLEMDKTRVSPGMEKGIGIDLEAVSGFIRRSDIVGWDVGIRIGDGGCSLYSDLVLGGSLTDADNISGTTWALQIDQPEAIDADYNFWGTTDCSSVQGTIDGQGVSWITDASHSISIPCSGTPAEPARWGDLKTRYLDGKDR
jgi:hypothetical protein